MQHVLTPSFSLVVPVYGNEQGIKALLDAVRGIAAQIDDGFEAVFVVDGSPDRSFALLRETLPSSGFRSRLISLSRNFGAFSAIRVGLEHASGSVIAVMAADLQEPPELVLEFNERLKNGDADVAFGLRAGRHDPLATRVTSSVFWWVYRRLVISDIPPGGVDIFAMTSGFRDELLRLGESNSSLLAQLFWLGGRREFVPYVRRRRQHGSSGWTLKKKLRYLSDSLFSFTDLPIRALLFFGVFGVCVAGLVGAAVLLGRLLGLIHVPGYAATALIITFFGALNSLGLGLVGTYAWRAYENTKARPLAVIQSNTDFSGDN